MEDTILSFAYGRKALLETGRPWQAILEGQVLLKNMPSKYTSKFWAAGVLHLDIITYHHHHHGDDQRYTSNMWTSFFFSFFIICVF